MKNALKWKPAKTIYPTDHILSSKAREVGTWGFKPQYENVKHVNINFILSNEYMRLWFKERELYQKENYSKQEKAQTEAHLKRGFVQRMMVNPKSNTRELPIIELKRFQNVTSKIDNRRTEAEKSKTCERYRRSLMAPPVTKMRYKPACSVNKTRSTNAKEANNKSVRKKNKERDKKAREQEPSSENLGAECQLVCKLTQK